MQKRHQVISLDVSIGSYTSFLRHTIALANEGTSAMVCFSNVHMVMEAHRDPDFAMTVNSADWVAADGMPIAKAIEWLSGIKQERIAGMDALWDLLNESQKHNLPVFFYGATESTLRRVVEFCNHSFPRLSVAGTFAPPFRPLYEEEEEAVVKLINESGAKLVFVALGCPKQERWMARMKGRIQAVMFGVGGALPMIAGDVQRAPRWMQQHSLEWFFRLTQEPKRLMGRYLTTNTTFLIQFILHYARHRVKKKQS